MELSQAISLIQHPCIPKNKNTTWADLGCGSGLFTNALGTLLAAGSTIYAVDTNRAALRSIKPIGEIKIEKLRADFIRDELNLENLDGILMANSLHFVEDKNSFIKKTDRYFAAESRLLIVEYDMDTSNPWVPYPISFNSLQKLLDKLGYDSFIRINEMPSLYNRAGMYSLFAKRSK